MRRMSTAVVSSAGMTQGAEQSLSGSPLLAIAPGPTQILSSSSSFAWDGILVEKHLNSPGERLSAWADQHVVSMVVGSCSSRFEYRRSHGDFIACLNRPGSITITPTGPVPDMRLRTPSQFVHCAIEPAFIHNVVHDLDRAVASPVFRPGIQEKSIQRILGLLAEELDTRAPLGRLYVDSLAQALVTRYVLFEQTRGANESLAHGLSARVLNRVREKIEANLDADLSLESLAEESGYSRAHFLRMFRAATGVTPHQYVLDLRLERAQAQLSQSGACICDVALSCGFSSQSHMTSLFRQRLKMTPGEFRRNARVELGRSNAA